jgi:hypothetical protein
MADIDAITRLRAWASVRLDGLPVISSSAPSSQLVCGLCRRRFARGAGVRRWCGYSGAVCCRTRPRRVAIWSVVRAEAMPAVAGILRRSGSTLCTKVGTSSSPGDDHYNCLAHWSGRRAKTLIAGNWLLFLIRGRCPAAVARPICQQH